LVGGNGNIYILGIVLGQCGEPWLKGVKGLRKGLVVQGEVRLRLVSANIGVSRRLNRGERRRSVEEKGWKGAKMIFPSPETLYSCRNEKKGKKERP